jgi:hypothetical protein
MSTDPKGIPLDFNDPIVTRDSIRQFSDIPDLWSLANEPIDYLVEGLLPKGAVVLAAGADGSCKSYVAEKLAVSVASGRPFLGRRCQRAPVLYLDYENPKFEVRQRLDLLCGDLISELADLKVWGTWLPEQPPTLGNELLLTIAKETKPLIIIDTLRAAHGCDENSSTEMGAVMNTLRYCTSQGATVLILHHLAKSEGSQSRGSSVIRSGCDVSLLQQLSDDTQLITLTCTKNRFGPKYAVTIRPDFDTGDFQVTDSPQFLKYNADLDSLQQIIERSPGLNQNSIYKKSSMRKSRLSELLKAGCGQRWEERKEGTSLIYFPIGSRKREQAGTGEQVQKNLSGLKVVPLSPLKGGDREQQPEREQEVVPEQVPSGTEKSLPSCPHCGSFAVYREADGSESCLTCENRE